MNVTTGIWRVQERRCYGALLASWWNTTVKLRLSRSGQAVAYTRCSWMTGRVLDKMQLQSVLENTFHAWLRICMQRKCSMIARTSVHGERQLLRIRGGMENLAHRGGSLTLAALVFFGWLRGATGFRHQCFRALAIADRIAKGLVGITWRIWVSRHRILRKRLDWMHHNDEQTEMVLSASVWQLCLSGWAFSSWVRGCMHLRLTEKQQTGLQESPDPWGSMRL